MTDSRQLSLDLEGERFRLTVDLDARENREVNKQLSVIVARSRRVSCLKQKGETHGDLPIFDQTSESLADE